MNTEYTQPELEPWSVVADVEDWFRYGLHSATYGKTVEAKAVFQLCQKMTHSPYFRGPLGQVYNDLGQYDRAETEARAFLKAFPRDRLGLHVLGRSLAETGHLDEAEAVYEELSAFYPTDEHAWLAYAEVLWRNGRRSVSREISRKGLRFCPESRGLHGNVEQESVD